VLAAGTVDEQLTKDTTVDFGRIGWEILMVLCGVGWRKLGFWMTVDGRSWVMTYDCLLRVPVCIVSILKYNNQY
jgi:hypothetical protein